LNQSEELKEDFSQKSMPVRKFWPKKNKKHLARSSSRVDFSWEKTDLNPYLNHQKPPKENKKRAIQIIIGSASLLAMIAVLLVHPLFQISIEQVHVSGLKQISSTKFKNAVSGIIGNPIFYFLPRSNYLLIDTSEMCEILKLRFPIENITTKKIFPNRLEINVVEKPPVILYDNGYAYATVGGQGEVVDLIRSVASNEWSNVDPLSLIPSSTISVTTTIDTIAQNHTPATTDLKKLYPEYPLVFVPAPRSLHANAEVLPVETISTITDWHKTLTKTLGIPVSYMTLTNGLKDANIVTGEGWQIKADFSKNTTEQINNLNIVLRDKNFPRPNLKYVDLRFKAHIFWQ
jgi:hypothetical protein